MNGRRRLALRSRQHVTFARSSSAAAASSVDRRRRIPVAAAARLLRALGASQDPCPFVDGEFGCARAFYASLRDSAIRLALSSFDFFTKKGYIAAGSPHSFNWRGDITRIRRDCKQYRQCIVFLLPLFFSTRRAQQEQGEMASKQVNKSLAEKPHGYEFLGPYVYLQNTSISTPQLTPPQPWRLCHLFRSARPGLCLHLPVQRHLRMPCAYLAFPFRLQL